MRAALAELAERTGADELMVTTLTHSPDARLASYRLVADAAGLPAPPTARRRLRAGGIRRVRPLFERRRRGLGSSSQSPTPKELTWLT